MGCGSECNCFILFKDSIPWYSLQLLTIAWGICLTIFGSSRRSVLRSGAGLRRPVKAEQMALTPEDDDKDTTAKTVQGTTLEVQDLSLPHQAEVPSRALNTWRF